MQREWKKQENKRRKIKAEKRKQENKKAASLFTLNVYNIYIPTQSNIIQSALNQIELSLINF